MILDAGVLIAIERGDESARTLLTALARKREPLRTSDPVVAQVWRNGRSQARLASFLKAVDIRSFDDGQGVGRVLARSSTNDVVDAHLVVIALKLGDSILTGDPDDLRQIADSVVGVAPAVHPWP